MLSSPDPPVQPIKKLGSGKKEKICLRTGEPYGRSDILGIYPSLQSRFLILWTFMLEFQVNTLTVCAMSFMTWNFPESSIKCCDTRTHSSRAVTMCGAVFPYGEKTEVHSETILQNMSLNGPVG